MQKATKNSRVAWDTRKGFDNQEPRPIYVGNYDDWDPEETSKQRWTEPTTPGAKKAIHSKEDPEVFKIGRYLCCHDPECGVSVKVVQASKVTWHFKRQWNFGNNPAYKNKCKNERMYRGGESMYHNTTTRTVARLLTPGKKLDGKTVAKKAEWEVFRNFQSKDGESVKLKPDVYVEFTDGTWFAIEVVFGHPPERNAHDAYGNNMVEIDLKKLGVVDSEQSFFKWIREGGIENALKDKANGSFRDLRFNLRQQIFDRQDEKEHRALLENQYSKCREEFGFDVDIDFSKVFELSEVEAYFNKEKDRRALSLEISNAIERNLKKYGERLERSVDEFNSVKEVNDYYKAELGEKLEQKKRDEIAKKKKIVEQRKLEEETKRRSNELQEELEKEIDMKVQQLEQEMFDALQTGEELPASSQFEIMWDTLLLAHKLISIDFIHAFWSNDYSIEHRLVSRKKVYRNSELAKKVDSICTNKEPDHRCFPATSEAAFTLCKKIAVRIREVLEIHEKTHSETYHLAKRLSAFLDTLGKYARKEHRTWERVWGSPLSNKLEEASKRFDVKKNFSPGSFITSLSLWGGGLLDGELVYDDPVDLFRPSVPRLLKIEELTSKDVTIDFGKKENHKRHTRDLIKICSSNKDAWNKLGISEVMELVVAEEDRRKMERAKKREQKKSSTSPSPKANTKAPSKPKVTRSPEADFERAKEEEAAAQKQREKDRASKAEKKNIKKKKNTKKKATPEDDKKAYFSELQRRVREVDRTARLGGKASRKAQRDLANFKKANKGKYEDDKP